MTHRFTSAKITYLQSAHCLGVDLLRLALLKRFATRILTHAYKQLWVQKVSPAYKELSDVR